MSSFSSYNRSLKKTVRRSVIKKFRTVPKRTRPNSSDVDVSTDEDVQDNGRAFATSSPVQLAPEMEVFAPARDISSIANEEDNNDDNLFAEQEQNDTSIDTDNDDSSFENSFPDFTALWTLGTHQSIVSALDAAMLFVSIQRRFKISDVAMDAIVRILSVFLKPATVTFKNFASVLRLFKTEMNSRIGNITTPIVKMCDTCFSYIHDGNLCKVPTCKMFEIRQTTVQYFCCNLEPQVKSLVKKNATVILATLAEADRIRFLGDHYTDVLTGEFYERLDKNPDNGTLWISMILNADGARPLHASSGSLWPCDAVAAELPPKLRYSFENNMILAMWLGEHKPNWHILLQNPLQELRHLQSNGFPCDFIPGVHTIKVRLLATVFDLQARASIWEHNQYNGAFGCMECLDPGMSLRRGVYVWPYAMAAPEKTTEWYLDAYQRIDGAKVEPYMGVKNRSVLSEFVDAASQNPLDFMHQAYRGVLDRILSALLKPEAVAQRPIWNLSNSQSDLDVLNRLQLQIRFPHDFRRTVQPLSRLKQSKASEYKNMILYTLIPCSKRLLCERGSDGIDFWHWLTLYHEISRRLTQDMVSKREVGFIDQLIDTWQLLVPRFLGEEKCTYNIHATRHMPKYLRLFGPVQNFSTFAFESFNGMYIRLVTNARGSMQQIANRVAYQRFCSQWIGDAIQRQDTVGTVACHIFKEIQKGTFFGGIRVMNETALTVNMNDISNEFGNVLACRAFTRAQKGATVLHSLGYTKRQNTCSYIACFDLVSEVRYGKIVQFIVHNDVVYAYIQSFIVVDNICEDIAPINEQLNDLWQQKLYGTFIKVARLSETFCFVPVIYLKCKCLIINIDDVTYLTEVAHSYEHN